MITLNWVCGYSFTHFSEWDSCHKIEKITWLQNSSIGTSLILARILTRQGDCFTPSEFSLSGKYSFFRFNLARNTETTYPTMLKYQIGNGNGTLDVRKQDLHIFVLNEEDLRSVHVFTKQFQLSNLHVQFTGTFYG